jgi:hypothetical protein
MTTPSTLLTGYEDHWATPVWLGTVHPVIDSTRLSREMARRTHSCRIIEPGSILDTDQTAAFFTTLAQTIRPTDPGSLALSVEIWAPGHRVPLAHSPTPWTAWCYLAAEGQDATGRSGALSLHDPRAGCDAATVPGLPWGRALTLQARPGITALAPGWLAASVLPVAPGHTLAVLTARPALLIT